MTTTVTSIVTLLLGIVGTWLTHLVWPRKSAAAPAAPATGTPALNVAAKAEAAGLTWLVPLLKAIETFNGPLIQTEAMFLHRLVEQQGGFAVLLDNAFNQILEARLAAGGATYLTRLASDAVPPITPRQLLDELEGKGVTPLPAAVSTTGATL